jgi:hypothetical protein
VDGLARVVLRKVHWLQGLRHPCPRNIITMVPFKAERVLVVACSNADFGLESHSRLRGRVLVCKACSRHSNLFVMQGNLPALDYERYTPEADVAAALEKCRWKAWFTSASPAPRPGRRGLRIAARSRDGGFQNHRGRNEWRG